jgi:tetratricopeptide (TPR) repeat protein
MNRQSTVKGYWVFFLFPLFFSACNFSNLSIYFDTAETHTLEMEIFKPAEKTLPYELYKVMVAYSSDVENRTDLSEYYGPILLDDDKYIKNKPAEAAAGNLQATLSSAPRFQVVNDKPGKVNLDPASYSWQEVKKLCERHDADGLILLSALDSKMQISTYYHIGGYTPPYFETSFVLKSSTSWMFFYPEKREVVDKIKYNNTRRWSEETSGEIDLEEYLQENEDYVNYSFEILGYHYGERVSPLWKPAQREYYVTSNQDFKKAGRLLELDKYQEAIDTWKRYLQHEHKRYQRYATYNIAVAHELLGNLDKAKEWAEKAYYQYRDHTARKYMKTLEERLEEQELLRKQLGTG